MTKPYHPDRDIVPAAAPSSHGRDTINRDGAEQIARELDAWWHARGFTTVNHWPQLAALKRQRKRGAGGEEEECRLWVVRSNLVNGLPPR